MKFVNVRRKVFTETASRFSSFNMPFHEKQQKLTRFFAIFVEANESDV